METEDVLFVKMNNRLSIKTAYKNSCYKCFAQQKGNLGYGDCSKHLAYSIERQVVGFGIQGLVMESIFR